MTVLQTDLNSHFYMINYITLPHLQEEMVSLLHSQYEHDLHSNVWLKIVSILTVFLSGFGLYPCCLMKSGGLDQT